MKGGKELSSLDEFFQVTLSNDKMTAQIDCSTSYEELQFQVEDILLFLNEKNITHGIDHEKIELLLKNLPMKEFPITVANGSAPIYGEDGQFFMESEKSSTTSKSQARHFREFMHIPSVQQGERIAQITLPTKGKPGKNVLGQAVRALPGKRVNIKPGLNVVFNKEDLSFYAATEGLVSIRNKRIDINPIYEVNETLSMKTGNIDFVGSVIIRGDVPTGYTVKAGGDVKVFGIVEAGNVIAKGSVYVSEGFSGLKKGKIIAGENLEIGYINQGIVEAGNSILVDSSIIHSECKAGNKLSSRNGSIIGGTHFAGKKVEAKDIGNRLNTVTEIRLGKSNTDLAEEEKLIKRKVELESMLEKIKLVGEKLKSSQHLDDSKRKITLLRQRNSQKQIQEQLDEINQKIETANKLFENGEIELIALNCLYSNTIIQIGKYKRKIENERRNIRVILEQNEIVLYDKG